MEKYNRRSVLSKEVRNTKNWKKTFAICECECWTIRSVHFGNLKRGLSKSCWCFNKERIKESNTKHWLLSWYWRHPLYNSRCWMKNRCNNKKQDFYKDYWWRWIVYSNEREEFQNFLEDMMPSRQKWLSLDRIDVNWNYCKENCRRATNTEQTNNARSNVVYEWKNISERANEIWIKYTTFYRNVKRNWFKKAFDWFNYKKTLLNK